MDIICEKSICYGCSVCVDICPTKAISMSADGVSGHFRPIINKDKCINCEKCKKYCTANHIPTFYSNIKTYAAWRKDYQKQLGSSSGGVAAAFYEEAIKKGWLIVGTVLDGTSHAYMCISDNADIIDKYKGSKYVQVDTQGIYGTILTELKNGRQVLFIGTPCQCEAARIIAGSCQNSLVTVDLICHGVPSQKLLKDYITWVGAQKRKNVDTVLFRSEWGEEMQMFSEDKKIWGRRMYWDYYLELFNQGYINNEACYRCPFAGKRRGADITIGDFWGIGKNTPFDYPKCHVSVIGVNTEKGEEFLNNCDELVLVEREWDEAVDGNSQLQEPLRKSKQFDLFWDYYSQKGLDEALRVTVFDLVTTRYKKEYPSFIIKNKIKVFVKAFVEKKV